MRWVLALSACLLLILTAWGGERAVAAHGRPLLKAASSADGSWIASWAASPQAPTVLSPAGLRGFQNVTLREILFSSAAGSIIRVRLTAVDDEEPLEIGRATVALAADGGSLVPGTLEQLTFSGRSSAEVPAGSTLLSDPVRLAVPALSRLAISVYLPDPTGPATQHVGAHETNYLAPGDRALDESSGPFTRQLSDWYFLDALDTYSPPRYVGAVVALGDSITAGVGSSANADANWPDDLARRLTALSGPTLSVVDAGIGGNRILNGSPCCGPSAVERFSADVADMVGARDVILLEGVNDLGFSQELSPETLPHTDVSAAQIISGDEHLIADAHAAGLRIFGATILPFEGARYWTPAAEAKREKVNRWILTSGAFDGTIDFAAAVADPTNTLRLNPAYDAGDHLHLDDAGYRALADAIPLQMLLGPAG